MEDRAFALLSRGRTFLAEVGSHDSYRHPVRVHQTVPGREISLEFIRLGSEGLPAAGDDAALVVPITHATWWFPTRVISPPSADDPIGVFGWPATAKQLDGRKTARFEWVASLRCRPADAEDEGWMATYTLDVSSCGIRIAHPRALEAGTELDIELILPDRPLRARGPIVWRRSLTDDEQDPMYTMGIDLRAMPTTDAARLSSLVQRAKSGRASTRTHSRN